MANRIRIRRTGTASQVPITTDLLTGEFRHSRAAVS